MWLRIVFKCETLHDPNGRGWLIYSTFAGVCLKSSTPVGDMNLRLISI